MARAAGTWKQRGRPSVPKASCLGSRSQRRVPPVSASRFDRLFSKRSPSVRGERWEWQRLGCESRLPISRKGEGGNVTGPQREGGTGTKSHVGGVRSETPETGGDERRDTPSIDDKLDATGSFSTVKLATVPKAPSQANQSASPHPTALNAPRHRIPGGTQSTPSPTRSPLFQPSLFQPSLFQPQALRLPASASISSQTGTTAFKPNEPPRRYATVPPCHRATPHPTNPCSFKNAIT